MTEPPTPSDAAPLDPEAVAAFAAASAIWRPDGDALRADLRFPTFRDAVAFIVLVAFAAEAAGHHPEITSTYDRLSFRLATHDAGGRVTERDLSLARAIESAHARRPGQAPGPA